MSTMLIQISGAKRGIKVTVWKAANRQVEFGVDTDRRQRLEVGMMGSGRGEFGL